MSLTSPSAVLPPRLAPGGATTPVLDECCAATRIAALERQLAERDRAYARLMDTVPDGIYALDAAGRFVELNRAGERIIGRSRAEVAGRHFGEYIAPEDREAAAEFFRSTMAAEIDRDVIELRVMRPDGERRLLQIFRAAVSDDAAVVGVMGVARDVTESRAREMQFRRAERMASVAPLLTGVCHELNNPLTSIKSFAELLLMDQRPAEDREALEIVQREAHRAAKIVSDLRVVARQAREVGTGRGMVELNALLERVVAQHREAARCAGVEVRMQLADGLPAAWVTEAQIEQVLQQLVENAVQAMHEQPGPRVLTLRTHRGSIGVVVAVEDTGPGIAPEHIDRVFDPFWTTRQPGAGTGLGLSLAHGIITDNGGRILVEGNPGRGAVFTVDLPAAEQAPVALGEVESETATARPLRLLVVDDEAPIRFSLQRYMERRGHHVEQAEEGNAALQLLAASAHQPPFDTIIADLRMPELDGEELLAALRARGDGLEQRVIFITGDQDSPDVADMLSQAGVPVVQKPFELAEIAQIIETHARMAG